MSSESKAIEYQIAVRKGDTRRIRALIKAGAKPPGRLMLYALINKHPELLSLLKQAGCDPNDKDGFNKTALGHAVNYYDSATLRELIEMGADPNRESLHLLPLVHAACLGRVEATEVLLQGGADPNRLQWNGLTPLLAAVRSNEIEIVNMLLRAGGNPSIKGPDGKDALQQATSMKNTAMVKLLKEAKRNKRGGTVR